MSVLPFTGSFDAVICWFISLGYYSEQFDEAFLMETARCLRIGGLLVVEAVSPIGMVMTKANTRGESTEETWVDNSLMSLHLTYDPVGGKNNVARVIVRDGVVRRHSFSARLYSPKELSGMLERCGFEVKRVVNRLRALMCGGV